MHLFQPEAFQQPEHLDELPFAPWSHPGLQEAAQRGKLPGQVPPTQGRRLVQGAVFRSKSGR